MAKQAYTSTLSKALWKWLNQQAKERGVTKASLIEDAIVFYKNAQTREEFIEGFKRAVNDPEMLELAEDGLTDHVNFLREYEEC